MPRRLEGGALVSGGGFEGVANASCVDSTNRLKKFSFDLRPDTEGPGGAAFVVSASAVKVALVHPRTNPRAIGQNFVRVNLRVIFIFCGGVSTCCVLGCACFPSSRMMIGPSSEAVPLVTHAPCLDPFLACVTLGFAWMLNSRIRWSALVRRHRTSSRMRLFGLASFCFLILTPDFILIAAPFS